MKMILLTLKSTLKIFRNLEKIKIFLLHANWYQLLDNQVLILKKIITIINLNKKWENLKIVIIIENLDSLIYY